MNNFMINRARGIVRNRILFEFERDGRDDVPEFDVYIVWFCKTLQNWKALVATTMADNRYYEVTHNGDDAVTYLDVYEKVGNVVIGNNPVDPANC